MKGKKLLFFGLLCSFIAAAGAFAACSPEGNKPDEGDEPPKTCVHTVDTLTRRDGTDKGCTTDGTETYWECPDCHKLFSDENGTTEIAAAVVIPAGHTLSQHIAEESTCKKAGHEEYWDCDVCHKFFSDENAANEIPEIPATALAAHTPTPHGVEQATCAADGTEAYWSCGVCGKLFSDENCDTEIEEPVAIPNDGVQHTPVEQGMVASGCTWKGHEAYYHCEVCERNFTAEDCTQEIEDLSVLDIPAAHKLTAVSAGSNAKVLKYPDGSTDAKFARIAHYKCSACQKTFKDADGTNEINVLYGISRVGLLLNFGSNLVDSTKTMAPNTVLYVADSDGKFTVTFSEGFTINNVSYIATGAAKPTTVYNNGWQTGAAGYENFVIGDAAQTLANTITVNMKKGEFLIVKGSVAQFTVNVDREHTLSVGENVIATKAYENVQYTFTPSETKTYSLTVPSGVSAAIGYEWQLDADGKSVGKNFDGVAGQAITFDFSASVTSSYIVTVGDEIPLPALSTEVSQNNFAVDGYSVALIQVADGVAEGSYTLTMSLPRNRPIIYFGKVSDESEVGTFKEYTGADDKGNVDLSDYKGKAELYCSFPSVIKLNDCTYDAVMNGNNVVITLTLKAGDILAFANGAGTSCLLNISMAAAS